MVPQCNGGFLSEELEQLIQVDLFVIHLQLLLAQFCSLQHLIGQLGQACCLFINERYKLSLRIFEPVDLQQSGACTLNRCQWRLERMGQSVENGGSQLLASFGSLGIALGDKGMRSFERDRGKGSNRVHGSSVELAIGRRACNVKRTDRSGPKSQYPLELARNGVVLIKLVKISGAHFIVWNGITPCLVHSRFARIPEGHGFNLKSVSDQACKLCTDFFAPVHHDDVTTR